MENIILITGIIVFFSGLFLALYSRKLEKNKNNSDENNTELVSNFEKKLTLREKELQLELEIKLREQELKLRESNQEIKSILDQREKTIEQGFQEISVEKLKIEKQKEELRAIKNELIEKKNELEEFKSTQEKKYLARLELISNFTKDEAINHLYKKTEKEVGDDLLDWQNKYLEKVQDTANQKAREIVAMAVQRCSSEVANEFTITTVKLSDEDQKGKIIGKGGRNIQWIEKTLGVELIIDDTPEVITISGFSSIRRHIAKRTIELLLEDGRIHPSSIEEKHEKAKAEIAQDIADSGQWAVNELGIFDFPAKLIRIIGRLKFRTSYGQNMLKHSVEMAKLAALLAHEINAAFPAKSNPINVEICIKGALLHDIGKAVDEDTQPRLSHIELGEKICDSFGLDWRIKKCISSHHDESYEDSEKGLCVEAMIVDACDNISGGRIGARKENVEAYFERMQNLEKIAETTPGVTKSWIMRGSRELWIFFDTSKVDSYQMSTITKEIAQRIQTDMTFPGEIKVIGFWEDKVVEYAH
jgi:ribonuclease Y